MPSNTKENGFETLIVNWLVNENGYEQGTNADYNQEYAIDEERLFRYLQSTQPRDLAELRILDTPAEKKRFLERLSRKLSDQGVIEILRKGFKYKNKTLEFYQVLPSKGNQRAQELYDENIFSVTRQLQYSKEYGRLALDLCIFLNGLPIITMELKNQFTLQNTADAVKQYKTDRDPAEKLFSFKRCIVHFAVDDNEIMMCTELKKDDSYFMPFNKGFEDGAGNPPNPNGIKTDYPVVKITAVYGLRRSEVLGLKWDSVDFVNNTLTIKHTVSKVTETVEKDKTKNASSYRAFPLMPEIRDMLLDLQRKEQENRRACGKSYHQSDYILKWDDGTPFSPDFVTRKFRQLLEKHDLPHIRFHELRHSCASFLLNNGFTLKDVQEWLGHADIKMTANIYGHLDVARKQGIADKIAEALLRE